MVVVNPHHALVAKRLKCLHRGKHANTIPVEKLKGLSLFRQGKGRVVSNNLTRVVD